MQQKVTFLDLSDPTALMEQFARLADQGWFVHAMMSHPVTTETSISYGWFVLRKKA